MERSEERKQRNDDKYSPPPDVSYPLGGATILTIPGFIRENAAEIMFKQDNDRLSVSTMILNALIQVGPLSEFVHLLFVRNKGFFYF